MKRFLAEPALRASGVLGMTIFISLYFLTPLYAQEIPKNFNKVLFDHAYVRSYIAFRVDEALREGRLTYDKKDFSDENKLKTTLVDAFLYAAMYHVTKDSYLGVLKNIPHTKDVLDYYQKEYQKDLSNIVILINDNNKEPDFAGVAFYSTIYIQELSSKDVKGIDSLFSAIFQEVFEADSYIVLNKIFLNQPLILEAILVHELRHIIDFQSRKYPDFFDIKRDKELEQNKIDFQKQLDKIQNENNLFLNSEPFKKYKNKLTEKLLWGRKDLLKEKVQTLIDEQFNNFIMAQLAVMPKKNSKMEKRAYLEEFLFLTKIKKLSSEEAQNVISTPNDYIYLSSLGVTPIPLPSFLTRYFEEIKTEMSELKKGK